MIDIGILDIADALDHKKAFLFTIYRLMVLVALNGFIGADAHIQVTILCCLSEKLHMTGVQQVVTAGDKDFLFHALCFFTTECVEHHYQETTEGHQV